MRDRQTCVGCGKKSPETETNYTLISAQFGWRLTRFKNPDGSLVIEWRCPSCWREYKRARNMAPSDPDMASAAQSVPGTGSRPAGRTPLPRPPTPFEAFRPRAPSVPGETRRRSPPPPPPPAPPQAQKRPTVPPRPSSPPRPTPASVPPTGRPGRPTR